MPSFLEYIKIFGSLPGCLTLSFAAYIAFFSSDIQQRTENGLICHRPKGNCYTAMDDGWVLDFYYAHRNDSPEELVHAVMTNLQMWGQDLTQIPGFEAATVANLKKIRTESAASAFAGCL